MDLLNFVVRSLQCLLLLYLATFRCLGATWYVDRAAAGSNNGTSWANAWTNLSAVVMTSVSPGDTIEVAGGTNYSGITFNKDGTAANPITFRLATDTNHQGHVWMSGINVYADYICVNGAFNTNYPIPAAVDRLDDITNNIGFHITSTFNGVNFSGPNSGVKLSWLHIYSCGRLTGVFPADGEPPEHGISIGDFQTNCVIAYCWLQDNIYGDSVNYPRSTERWGDVSIHDCLVYNVGDDAFQMNGGFDIFRCKISRRTWGYASGHTDCFQTWGNKIRIHHNVVYNFAALPGGSDYCSISYAQFSTEVCGDFLFYNNLIYNDTTNRLTAPGFALSFDAWWAPNKLITNQIITNIVIANNLFNLPDAPANGWTMYGAATDASRGTNYCHTLTNCLVANNLVIDSHNWLPGNLSGVAWAIPGPSTNPTPVLPGDPASIVVTPQSIPLLNNVLKGSNWRMAYMGQIYSDISAAGRAYGFNNNWTNLPSFAAYTRLSGAAPFVVNDYHLQSMDTVARDKGYNLSAYAAAMPMLNVDLDGNSRGFNGAWDIGPYEYVPGNLLLHVNFDDSNWTKGYLLDASGNNRHGYEFGYGAQTNWPTKSSWTNPVTTVTSQCGAFQTWADTNSAPGSFPYGMGQYVGVTNIDAWSSPFTGMTICVWAYFDPSQSNGVPQSWTYNANATLLSAGYAHTNAWDLGRNGTQPPLFRIWTNNTGSGYVSYRFGGTFNSYGESDKWHHYAVTFDNGVIILYQDGEAYLTNAVVYQPTIGVTGGWIGIGCKTHGASVWSTPQFGDDLYPNHGWMNGKIDDVRIYRGTLMPSEIRQIYRGAPAVPTRPSAPRNVRVVAN